MESRIQTGGLRSFGISKDLSLDEARKMDVQEGYERYYERKRREKRNKIIFWIVLLIIIVLGIGSFLLFR